MKAFRLLSAAFFAFVVATEDVTSPPLRGSRPLSENNTLLPTVGAGAHWDSTSHSVAEEPSGDPQWTALVLAPRETGPQGNLSKDAMESLYASGNHSEDAVGLLLASSGGWYYGGDKVWGSGAGVENINPGNVGYYNEGMAVAHAGCGGPGCALITNPPGHRTVQQFHIHLVHYQSYGKNLKSRLESRVCGSPGWHGGGLPCSGTAAFFPGFPAVFSAAMSGGSIHGASVIAWPASCGGGGTIVELAYGCSIEHQIRGDFNPALR